jgi:hypothetical protein
MHFVSSEGGGSESIRSPAIDAKPLMHDGALIHNNNNGVQTQYLLRKALISNF